MVEFRPIIVAMLIVGLFAFALISGGIMLGSQNNAPQNIGDDPSIASYKTALENNLRSASSDVNSSEKSLEQSPLTLSTGGLILDTIGKIWKTMKTIPVTVYNLTAGVLFTRLFGNEAGGLVFGVIATILILSIIFAVWKWVSTGEGG